MLIKPGPIVAAMSGSIGGIVASRNRGGAYFRNRTIPINPNTDRQSQVRDALAFLADQWAATLNAGQRIAWDLYATNVEMTNRLGEATHYSGYNHYIRSNLTRKVGGLGLVQDGPVDFTIPAHDPAFSITASEGTQEISYAYDAGMDWADENGAWLALFQGLPQNPQINFFGGPYRGHSFVEGINGAPPASPKVAAVAYAIAEGQHLWSYARIIRADGRISEPFYDSTFCAA